MVEKYGGPESFVLQEDDCGTHRARFIATCFHTKEVSRMQWHAQSPYFNSIVNVLGVMKTLLLQLTGLP